MVIQNKEQKSLKVSYHIIEEDEANQRLDNYLARILKGVPRSMIYRILRRGEVRVNKGRVNPSYKLRCGDEVRVPPVRVSEDSVFIPSSNLHIVKDLSKHILFENDLLLVVNKPSGIAAHGGSGIEFGLIESLRALRSECKFLELAHRLDKETSGCLIKKKRRSALRNLHEQFRQRIVKKRYLTLVPGKWNRKIQIVDAPLVRNELRSGERMVQVSKDGAPSTTTFDVVEYFKDATLLAAMPHTGRTHQIRVHCAYKGHPVGNDDKYGDKEFNKFLHELGLKRMFLHAQKISFLDPQSGDNLKVEAPLDEQLQNILNRLKENAR